MDLNENQELSTWKFWKKRRHIVTALSFLGFFMAFVLRVNLSVAIVKMTSNRTLIDEDGQTYDREFPWDSKLQALVLSSFFYGYIITPLPGGWLAARIGGSRMFGLGIAITSLLTIISPLAAKWNVYALIAVRAIEGIFEGVTYPSMSAILSYWAPPLERSKMATIIYTGSNIGIVLGMPFCSIMVERFDWPSIFYIPGIVGILWYICWCILVKDRPDDDPHITQSELVYINNSLGAVDNKQEISHPWKGILTSVPVWAICIANTADNWGFYTMVTYLPKIMSDALGFSLEEAGIYAGLPYILCSALTLSAGQLADYLRSKNILTTTQVRKSFTCTAFVCQSVFMACTGFIMTPIVAVTCIVLSIGFGGLTVAGYSVNYLDIGGKHTSIIIGISGYLIVMPGIISPIVTGYIVQNETPDEWRTVFFISSAIYLFGAVIYGVFSSAEEQPWTKSGSKDMTGCDNPSFKETH